MSVKHNIDTFKVCNINMWRERRENAAEKNIQGDNGWKLSRTSERYKFTFSRSIHASKPHGSKCSDKTKRQKEIIKVARDKGTIHPKEQQ